MSPVERGADVHVGAGVELDAARGGRIVLGDACRIGDGCRLVARGGTIAIGPGAVLGERCTLLAVRSITIGAGARLEAGAMGVDFDHGFADPETPIRLQPLVPAAVAVGARARIGPGASVLRGVTVGDDAAVGPHAVVTRDVAAGAAVEGVPARAGGAERQPRP